MNINSNFLNIRKQLGLNQTEYAEKLETSQNLISKYEKGQIELPSKIINNLHKIFNININWLLTGTGEMFIENESSNNNKSVLNFEDTDVKLPELIDNIKKLSKKRQEYYYYRIKADLIDDELN